jgi:hypothetical protein
MKESDIMGVLDVPACSKKKAAISARLPRSP